MVVAARRRGGCQHDAGRPSTPCMLTLVPVAPQLGVRSARPAQQKRPRSWGSSTFGVELPWAHLSAKILAVDDPLAVFRNLDAHGFDGSRNQACQGHHGVAPAQLQQLGSARLAGRPPKEVTSSVYGVEVENGHSYVFKGLGRRCAGKAAFLVTTLVPLQWRR